MSVSITYENLHRLWPRGDGAVRMLMYLWRIVCQGAVPNFTDEQLAKRFFRQPATIRRWRARWEEKGILITSFRCQRTFYEVNIVALQEAIQAAILEEEVRERESKALRLEKKTRLFDEISQKLRSQWTKTHLASDQSDRSELITTQGSTTSIPLNQSSVPDKPESGLADNNSGLALEGEILGNAPQSNAEVKPARIFSPSEQSLAPGQNVDSKDLVRDEMRLWMMEAARRLVEQNGQQWNQNLQRLLDGLETKSIIRAVSSLWEQSQKGNVRNAPKFLTRAVQRKYFCTKGWSLPDELPGAPFTLNSSPLDPKGTLLAFPHWLPVWAKQLLEKLVGQGEQLNRYELVDGGIQIWTETDIQFFPHNFNCEVGCSR